MNLRAGKERVGDEPSVLNLEPFLRMEVKIASSGLQHGLRSADIVFMMTPLSARRPEPRPSSAVTMGSAVIGFYVPFEYQRAMLDPIYDLVKQEFPCIVSPDPQALIRANPRILVQAEGAYQPFRKRLPTTLMVFTRHGFSSKNFAKGAFAGCDYACVSSEWVREDCVRRGWIPRLGHWVTGFTPMDPVFRALTPPRRSLLPEPCADGPVLLWAPTWNLLAGSVDVLRDNWIERLRQTWRDLSVVIKPHPHIVTRNPDWMARFREWVTRDPRTVLVDDPSANVFDYLPIADALLTDCSSVMFYFLALDRPIILVNNPRRFDEPEDFDPEGPEWSWRDMGIEIEHSDVLPDALRRCFEHPRERAEQRARYRQRVFGHLLDGRAAERIAERLRSLLRPSERDHEWVDVSWNSVKAMAVLEETNNRLGRQLKELGYFEPLLPLTRVLRALDRVPALKAALRRLAFFRRRNSGTAAAKRTGQT